MRPGGGLVSAELPLPLRRVRRGTRPERRRQCVHVAGLQTYVGVDVRDEVLAALHEAVILRFLCTAHQKKKAKHGQGQGTAPCGLCSAQASPRAEAQQRLDAFHLCGCGRSQTQCLYGWRWMGAGQGRFAKSSATLTSMVSLPRLNDHANASPVHMYRIRETATLG